MRKFSIIMSCALVLVLLASPCLSQEIAKKTQLYLGGNLGMGVLAGAHDDLSVETGGWIFGGTAKLFIGRIGIGGTYNTIKFNNDKDKPGKIEAKLNFSTVDVLYDFSKKENERTFIAGYFGRGTEKVSGDMKWNTSSGLYGIGIGYIDLNDKIAFGIDLRYLNFTDADNSSGIFEVYFTIGFSHSDF